MIQVRVAQQSAVSVRIAGAAPVRVDVTGTAVVSAPEYSGPYDITPLFTAHDKSGAPITGTSTKDADTSDATAAVAEVLNGKTFYARGAKMTGTMPNNGEVNGEISTVSGKYTIPMGFHDGAGGVTIAATEQAKLVPANIREGVTVLGVKGSMSGSEGMKPQAKSVTPTFEQQVVLPDKAYNCLSQVTVQAIPATYVDNAAGGQTLTIGG